MAKLKEFVEDLIDVEDFEDEDIAKFFEEEVALEHKSIITHRWCGTEDVRKWWELTSGFLIGFLDLGDEADFIIKKKGKPVYLKKFNFINPDLNNDLIKQTDSVGTAKKFMKKSIKDGKNFWCIDQEGYRLHFDKDEFKVGEFDRARGVRFEL